MKTKELIVKDYAAPEISVEVVAAEAGFAASTQDLTTDEYIKFLFLSSLAIAAAFTVSCNKENIEGDGITNDGEAVLFAAHSVINASSASTKTTLDGT